MDGGPPSSLSAAIYPKPHSGHKPSIQDGNTCTGKAPCEYHELTSKHLTMKHLICRYTINDSPIASRYDSRLSPQVFDELNTPKRLVGSRHEHLTQCLGEISSLRRFPPPPHSQLPQMIQPRISSANSAPPTLEIETPPRPLWARYMLHSLHLPLTPLPSPFHSHHPGCNKSSYHTAPGFPTRSGRPVVSHTISMHLQPPCSGTEQFLLQPADSANAYHG